MADKDYQYVVEAQDLAPYVARKENMDVVRLLYDFSCYLDPGEAMVFIDHPTTDIVPPDTSARNWRQDYPVDANLTSDGFPTDAYPLRIVSEGFTGNGQIVEIWVAAGTPGICYVVSFVAVGSSSQRRKQVDTLISIEQPVNPLMLGTGPIGSGPDQLVVIGGSANLPAGFAGTIIFQNSGNLSNVVIVFPPSPQQGQTIEFIDALGKDGSFPVTFDGYLSDAMDGDGSLTFTSNINYDCLRWVWTGSPGWHLMSARFNFLA